ncbi:Uncharacterised protein [Serratia marcescens]|nr:Uncharacterised protein [Serratia marcescens]
MSKCTLQNTNGNIKGIKLTCIVINIKRSTNKITLIVFSFKIAMSIISFLSQIRFILMITLKSLLQHALLMTFGSLLLTAFTVQAETTVVFLRHGEKTEAPTGQLTCKGFNRALALPSVLLTRFGQPDAIYAAAPKQNKTGSSLRPLSTILPTAIRAEHPVILKYHATETDGLVSDLLSTSNRKQWVFVSWEHKNLVVAAKTLVNRTGGDPQQIPSWPGHDFDSLYIVKLNDQGRFVSFSEESEGLNEVSDRCQQ